MAFVYVYVMDTMADWEVSYAMAELNSRRFFRKDAKELTLRTVSYSKDAVHSMGGLTILPDCTLDEAVVNRENMLRAAQSGFINATDLADWLVKKGMPFRSAYKISGLLVRYCIENGTVLEELPLEIYRQYSELFDEELYQAIDLKTCMEKRISEGGTSVASVKKQIAAVRKELEV